MYYKSLEYWMEKFQQCHQYQRVQELNKYNNAQADLRLCWLHIPHCWKSHVAAQMVKKRKTSLSSIDCGMQYVGQTCRFQKTRFSEHYRRTKKPRKIDNFLYLHFKQTNHPNSSISIQPVEKITYGDNSTKRYRNILRHKLELKWIKLLQTPHPLGFNDNIYHEGNISRLPDFDVFSLIDIRKRNN